MANNYAQASEILEIPADKLARAKEIMERLQAELEEDDDYGCLPFDWAMESCGIWFSSEESLDLDAVEHCVRTLQEELELDEPFVMEAAFTCSRPRCGEFGGAAFRAQRGQPTVWLNTGDLRDWKPDRLRPGLESLERKVRDLEEFLLWCDDQDTDTVALGRKVRALSEEISKI
jgi:hypothetical protein